MHTGVQVYARPGHEERGRELLQAAVHKLYTGDVPELRQATQFAIGREAATIQEAYVALVDALDGIDLAWPDALNVARPPDPTR